MTSTGSKFHLSKLMRMRNFNMKIIFQHARLQPDFFQFFPNSCFKKYPPKTYFWPVYASLQPQRFNELYAAEMTRIRRRIHRPFGITVDQEHANLLQQRQEENLNLLNRLRQPGVDRNIVYLRRTRRPVQPNRGPIEQFLQNPQRRNQEDIFHGDE
jgi:hypothetical protein